LNDFCKQSKIKSSGSKKELIKRIIEFLETGKVKELKKKKKKADGPFNPLNPTMKKDWVNPITKMYADM